MFGVYAKVELPVFLNHPEKPLSFVELLENYDDLIHCADYIEEVTMGERDLTIDHIEASKANLTSKEEVGVLRSTSGSYKLGAHWKQYNEFIFLEKTPFPKKREYRDLWVWNHEDKYAKYMQNKMIIPYHSVDIQKVEIDALEEILRIRQKDSIWE